MLPGQEPRTVVLCSNAYPPNFIGGAELIAHYQAKEAQRRGWRVVVFAGELDGPGRRHSMRRDSYDGLEVFRIALEREADFNPRHPIFAHPAVDEHFETVLEECRPDVAHMHNVVSLSAGLIHRAKRRGIKTVVTVHDHWGFCFKNTLMKSESEICTDYSRCAECMPFMENGIPIRMRRDFMALQLAEVDAFIAPSRYLAEAYVRAGIPKAKIHQVWYGVDVQRLSGMRKRAPAAPIRFTFIGYFGRHKGVHVALEALRLLPGKDAVLNLVGGGDLVDAVRQQVRQGNLSKSVRFLGKIGNDRIHEVFAETDVLLLPSIWPENQPVTITEAMAARTPVIASRIGGIPELVDDGLTGYLCEPGNAADLAAKMNEFIRRPALVAEFGEAGFRKIESNSVERRVEEMLAVYERAGPAPAEAARPLIACAGAPWGAERAQAMEALPHCRFVMAEWLAEDQLAQAAVLWVADVPVARPAIRLALESGVPLLVPEQDRELRELCRTAGCGLYYANALEAQEAIRYLLEREAVRRALAANTAGAACTC